MSYTFIVKKISVIINIATTIFSLAAFQLFTILDIGTSIVERGMYTFVCWFFVFLLCLFIYSKVPENIAIYVSNFSFSLMRDGILLFATTLLVSWIVPLFSSNVDFDAPIIHFSIYYLVFASLIKAAAQKKFIPTITITGLSILFIMIAANALSLLGKFEPYFIVYVGIDVLLLIGILLYYFLNRMLSELSPENLASKSFFEGQYKAIHKDQTIQAEHRAPDHQIEETLPK